MKEVIPQPNWPSIWKMVYSYDAVEVYGKGKPYGYCCAYKNRFKNVLDIIQKTVKPNARILDIGAAQGNYSLKLAELGYLVTWNDIKDELIDYVKMKYEHGALDFVPGNIYGLDINRKFDLVLIGEIIEHVAYPDRFLKQISQFVNKGGYILLTTPNGEYFRFNSPKYIKYKDPSKFEKMQFRQDGDGHIFLLHLDEINFFAKAIGLDIIEVRFINNFLTCGYMKLNFLLRYLSAGLVQFIERLTSKALFIRKKINTCTIVLFKAGE